MIDLNELLVSRVDAITRRAVEPIPFDPPTPSPSPSLLAAWNDAQRDVRCRQAERQARQTGPADAGLNALTRQLIVEPINVEVGERHRRLFSAAANMAELGTIDGLILAVLTEPGLDTGLPPREVERQIRTGIEHTRRQRDEVGAGMIPDVQRRMQRKEDDVASRFGIRPSVVEPLALPASTLGQTSEKGVSNG